ncbi:Helix-turn-helix [Saccharopolyspora antimicrobica]|uniref:Helix-turn-helix n=1 Tax=Saccharopolyspora antimicrobica TaxID=455193 RepID=A0A1I5E780_9PSEU|nr:helix-turn-helix transcriptional regulator [Saccharopolyspora antimicrobica]RKT86702.1 helix-turn-helix protein [Saccharopolyspora antimicrobica]SFO07468.1 Helix-turn-helix [Saccharopolyspora antimicrobica]
MARQSDLAQKRRSRGHTQETLAHRLEVDVSTVARWERGASTPTPRMREALARELGLSLDQLAGLLPHPAVARELPAVDPVELIKDVWTSAERDGLASRLAENSAEPGLTGDRAVRVAHQWLITPPPPAVAWTSESGRRIGSGALGRIQARLRYLHHADDVVAGGDLHSTIRGEVARTATLLRTASYPEEIGRGLLRAIAELCQLAGWSTADAGHIATAEHYYLSGIQAAHAADDPVLAAQVVSALAGHLTEYGRARDAVLVAKSAQARIDGLGRNATTPTVRALLHARASWAHVAAGEPGQAATAIQRAQDEYACRRDGDPDPAWVYWLTPEEMEIIVGRVDTALGRTRQARQRLTSAIRSCDHRRVRETALYTTWLAHAHLRAQDVDGASALANRAQQLSETIPSDYSERAVRQLTRQLAAAR